MTRNQEVTQSLSVGPRHFRGIIEFERWVEIRRQGFTSWYVGRPSPWSLEYGWLAMNAGAELFPEFYTEVRTPEGRAVGYLAAAPAYWCGSPQALQPMSYYENMLKPSRACVKLLSLLYVAAVLILRSRPLFARLAAPLRTRKITGGNSLVFIAMVIDPAAQGQDVPGVLIAAARTAARGLGFTRIIAPFRPNRYGEWKAARRAEHSESLFAEYCAATRDDGLPVDPWLRSVARKGARFVKLEPRSYSVMGSLTEFEAFRREHRPDAWYSPTADVWECGETATWYVDRCRRLAVAIEPNYWGVLDLSDSTAHPADDPQPTAA